MKKSLDIQGQMNIFDMISQQENSLEPSSGMPLIYKFTYLYTVRIDKVYQWCCTDNDLGYQNSHTKWRWEDYEGKTRYTLICHETRKYMWISDEVDLKRFYKTREEAEVVAKNNLEQFCTYNEKNIIDVRHLTDYIKWDVGPSYDKKSRMTAEIGIDRINKVIFWRGHYTYSFGDCYDNEKDMTKKYTKIKDEILTNLTNNHISPNVVQQGDIDVNKRLYYAKQYKRYGDMDYGFYGCAGKLNYS